MTDIEIKRKELETAKRIRAAGYSCMIACESCIRDYCPGKNSGATECYHWRDRDWDAFSATREAELAEIEKTTTKACEKCGGAGFYYTKGATTMEAVKRVCECQDQPSAPTLDDFALALIQGGYFNMTMGEDAAIMNLISRAGKIKDAFDARRGI